MVHHPNHGTTLACFYVTSAVHPFGGLPYVLGNSGLPWVPDRISGRESLGSEDARNIYTKNLVLLISFISLVFCRQGR